MRSEIVFILDLHNIVVFSCFETFWVNFLVATVATAEIIPQSPPIALKGIPTRIPGPVRDVAIPEDVRRADKVPEDKAMAWVTERVLLYFLRTLS